MYITLLRFILILVAVFSLISSDGANFVGVAGCFTVGCTGDWKGENE